MDWKKLFPQFEPELIEIIEKNAVQKTFAAGEVIMRTGQYIKSTACAVSMICALQSETSEITAIAEVDTEVLLIPVQLMDDLMNQYKSWYQFVIQTYRSRFDELISVVDNIAFHNMDERLEFYLKRHAKNSGKNIIETSHQQIADDLNSSREVISRLLKKMEQRKLVKLNRNMIELPLGY